MRKIMVVERDRLFPTSDFQGLALSGAYEASILDNYSWMEKEPAETNESFKQPIAYAVVIDQDQVYCYQRSVKGGEGRLHGKWSVGIGGHIEPLDDCNNPIQSSLVRELEEEIGLVPESIDVLGYINDDTDAVGRVHFGILYAVKGKVAKTNYEIKHGGFQNLNFLQEKILQGEAEGWTEIAYPAIKSYLQK